MVDGENESPNNFTATRRGFLRGLLGGGAAVAIDAGLNATGVKAAPLENPEGDRIVEKRLNMLDKIEGRLVRELKPYSLNINDKTDEKEFSVRDKDTSDGNSARVIETDKGTVIEVRLSPNLLSGIDAQGISISYGDPQGRSTTGKFIPVETLVDMLNSQKGPNGFDSSKPLSYFLANAGVLPAGYDNTSEIGLPIAKPEDIHPDMIENTDSVSIYTAATEKWVQQGKNGRFELGIATQMPEQPIFDFRLAPPPLIGK